MLPKWISCLLASGLVLVAGCGGKGQATAGGEATLADLDRAVASTAMMNGGRRPQSVEELTNFLSVQGLRLPTPPPGKKLALDQTGHVVFADQ